MRAMILAAGRGTRMGTLSDLCAKPALPVRGIPVVAYELAWLAQHGVREVAMNLHHRGDDVREAALAHCPDGLSLHFVEETTLRGTGGGIAGVRAWLADSDVCVVLAGDMLVEFDLTAIVRRHRERDAAATFVLRDDPRAAQFGTLGYDRRGRLRRIGRGFDLGDEHACGVFLGVRIFSPRALADWPEDPSFEDLRDVFAGRLTRGDDDLVVERLDPSDCVWEPVGTPAEYLAANFEPPRLTPLDPSDSEHARILPGPVVAGTGARIPASARLERVVVWADEHVPEDFEAREGVFAGRRFHARPKD